MLLIKLAPTTGFLVTSCLIASVYLPPNGELKAFSRAVDASQVVSKNDLLDLNEKRQRKMTSVDEGLPDIMLAISDKMSELPIRP